MNDFFSTSQEVANDFLQSIVFIDDKAFNVVEESGNHDFDAYNITQAFAKKKKICAVYKPKTTVDIDYLADLAKKADVTVLDWQINLDEEPVPVGKEEEDEEAVDPRGPHTLKIIRTILSNQTDEGSLKLIIVYTGEIALEDITDDIYKALSQDKIPELKKSVCEVSTDNIKILIIAKPDNEKGEDGVIKSKFKHNATFNERVKSYEELPDFILNEFAKMTSGLLTNFVLTALTVLRNNTFRLIKLYNKELDTAYLTHRLLLPNQEDSKEQLIDIFSDSVQALLHYNNTGESVSSDQINSWIDTKTFSKNLTIANKTIALNNDFLKIWVKNNFEKAVSDNWGSEVTEDNLRSINKEKEKLYKFQSLLTGEDKINKEDVEFSILTHHKSVFKPKGELPKLGLGTVVKGDKSGYWVCIQQRCDSVRLDGVRRFLFLPLKDVTENLKDKFHFITRDSKRLQLAKKSFNLRTIKFLDESGEGIIRSSQTGEKFNFAPLYKVGHNEYNEAKDENYEWILDLKDLHAQRIAHDFANELSRVGLDESEWLRRRSG